MWRSSCGSQSNEWLIQLWGRSAPGLSDAGQRRSPGYSEPPDSYSAKQHSLPPG